MYQAPDAERTEAWKPVREMSAWIVEVTSSSPRPLYVPMSGCFAARPGAMICERLIAKRWNLPLGSGSEMTSSSSELGAGAAASIDRRFALFSENA